VALTASGDRAVTCSADGKIGVWEVRADAPPRWLTGHAGPVRDVALSGDGRHLLRGGDDHTPRVWDAEQGRELFQLTGHTREVWSVALAADGRRALSSSADCTVRLRGLPARREVGQLLGHTNWVRRVVLSPDGRRALTGGGGGSLPGQPPQAPDYALRLWDVAQRQVLQRFEGPGKRVECVAFAPDGRRALSCGLDLSLRLWPLPE
jgi:WD40 repeat protein